jgi:hypothetical protein
MLLMAEIMLVSLFVKVTDPTDREYQQTKNIVVHGI